MKLPEFAQRAWQGLWTAGDPLGDTLVWIQGKSESVGDAFREKAGRIVDSYKNR